MIDVYTNTIALLAEARYEIDREIIDGYEELIAAGYVNNFTARRMMELIAADLFG